MSIGYDRAESPLSIAEQQMPSMQGVLYYKKKIDSSSSSSSSSSSYNSGRELNVDENVGVE